MTLRTHAAATLAATTLALAPAAVRAQVAALEKLQVHGYLTQGYGESSQLGFAGIPTDATGDYRTAALQLRYSLTDDDHVVVQFRHRRLGTSPLMTGEGDVTLNWAFYQRELGPVRVKLGKLPIPKGIFNETRAVGTILPFFRAPYNFYAEGFETIDGGSIANTVALGQYGSVETSAYVGGFGIRIPYTGANGVTTMINQRMEAVRGGQVWYNTPVSGLRVGVSGMRFRSRKATDTSTTPTSSEWTGSIDGSFTRVQLRGEYSNTSTTSGHLVSYYAQAGVRVTEKLSLNVQNDIGDRSAFSGAQTLRWRNVRDFAAGANYQFTPNLALKVEQHDVKGYAFDTPIATSRAAGKSKYFVASVSTSF